MKFELLMLLYLPEPEGASLTARHTIFSLTKLQGAYPNERTGGSRIICLSVVIGLLRFLIAEIAPVSIGVG